MTVLNINDIKSAASFLMASMVDAGRYAMRESFGMTKPTWLSQTERFESFFSQLAEQSDALTMFSEKFVAPLFDSHQLSITSPIINERDVIQDEFLKIKDEPQLRLSKTPRGLYFHSDDGAALKSLYLPVSEAYTNAVELSMRNKQRNVMMPVRILLGFYSVIFYGLKDNTDVVHGDLESVRSNIKVLNEYIEELGSKEEEPQQSGGGPMDMIKNLLGGVNFDQIGEMMNKVTQDENASKEFAQVFGKMTEGIQSGKAPLDVMGDIIKNATGEEIPAGENPIEQLLPGLARLGEQPVDTEDVDKTPTNSDEQVSQE